MRLFPHPLCAAYTLAMQADHSELRTVLERELAELQREQPNLPELRTQQREQLTGYLALLLEYRRAAQLTALRRPAALARELVAESLRLAAPPELPRGGLLLDLGSGNGSPVIPLAIACPELDCHACEVRERRLAFLRHCAVQLRLPNLHVLDCPAEQLTASAGTAASSSAAGRWDILTSRAFAPPERLLPLAARLLGGRGGGELRGFLGAEAEALRELAPRHGFTVMALEAYGSVDHSRHVYRLQL